MWPSSATSPARTAASSQNTSRSRAAGRTLEMAENFRSIKPIVEDAQRLLTPVQNKVQKRVRAINAAAAGERGVVLRIVDIEESLDAHAAFILDCLREARRGGKDKNLAIVLCRTNNTLEDLEEAVGNKARQTSGLAFYTFHGAKGLQGKNSDCIRRIEVHVVSPLAQRGLCISEERTRRTHLLAKLRPSYDG